MKFPLYLCAVAFFSFLAGLFCGAISIWTTLLLNDTMTDGWWIEKDLEGICRRQIEVLLCNLLTGTEENHDRPQSG
jgi:hypothetical protein